MPLDYLKKHLVNSKHILNFDLSKQFRSDKKLNKMSNFSIQQLTSYEKLMQLQTINVAAESIVQVCITFNLSVETVLPIISARAKILLLESKS